MKKILSVLSIILQAILLYKTFANAWQQHYHPPIPLIEHSLVQEVTFPYFTLGLTVLPFTIITFLLYRKDKYMACIIIGIAMMIWGNVGLSYL